MFPASGFLRHVGLILLRRLLCRMVCLSGLLEAWGCQELALTTETQSCLCDPKHSVGIAIMRIVPFATFISYFHSSNICACSM